MLPEGLAPLCEGGVPEGGVPEGRVPEPKGLAAPEMGAEGVPEGGAGGDPEGLTAPEGAVGKPEGGVPVGFPDPDGRSDEACRAAMDADFVRLADPVGFLPVSSAEPLLPPNPPEGAPVGPLPDSDTPAGKVWRLPTPVPTAEPAEPECSP